MRKKPSQNVTKTPKTHSKKKVIQPEKINKEMDEEMSEDIRENLLLESENLQQDAHTNWSQAQDRSEDFINELDPFTQETKKHPKSKGLRDFSF